MKMEKRPELLPMVLPVYERESSTIPDRIRISFSDGSTAVYDLHVDQPHPLIMKNIEVIRGMEQRVPGTEGQRMIEKFNGKLFCGKCGKEIAMIKYGPFQRAMVDREPVMVVPDMDGYCFVRADGTKMMGVEATKDKAGQGEPAYRPHWCGRRPG